MAGIEGLDQKSLQKTVLVFALDDVLVGGTVAPTVDAAKTKTVLTNLSKLAAKVPIFRFFVVSSYQQEITLRKLDDAGIRKFFPDNRIRFVNAEYLDSKEQLDREIYEKALSEDALFRDEYFKQKEVERIRAEFDVEMEKMVLVGHDLFFDAYYSQRFSKIDFVLLKETLSNQNVRHEKIVKGLNYVHMDWKDIRDVLLGKFPPADYMQLRNYIHFYLQQRLVSPQTMGKLIDARIKQIEKRNETIKKE
jgi:hypothetical protein